MKSVWSDFRQMDFLTEKKRGQDARLTIQAGSLTYRPGGARDLREVKDEC